MAAIYEHRREKADGSIAVTYCKKVKENGKWVTKYASSTVKSKREAQDYFDNITQQNDTAPAVTTNKKTIRKLFKTWIALLKDDPNYSRAWERLEAQATKYMLDPKFGIGDLDLETEARPARMAQWMKAVQNQPNRSHGKLANYTVINIVNACRNFFSKMVFHEHLTIDPWTNKDLCKLMPPQTKVIGNDVIHLTKEHAVTLVKADGKILPLVWRTKNVLGLCTGARDGELQGLKFSDLFLDTETPYLRIDRQLDPKLLEIPPKKESHRSIPLHPLAHAALAHWKAVGFAAWVGRSPKAGDYLFPNPDGSAVRPDSSELFRTHINTAQVPALYDGKYPYSMHATRRTFLTLLRDAGVSQELRDALAGHRGKGVQERHYIAHHIAPFYAAVCKLPFPAAVSWLPVPAKAAKKVTQPKPATKRNQTRATTRNQGTLVARTEGTSAA